MVCGGVLLGDLEVAPGEAGDGLALLVRDHHVHGDDVDLAGEGHARRGGGGFRRRRGGPEKRRARETGPGAWAAATVHAAAGQQGDEGRGFFFMTNHDFCHRRGEKSTLTGGARWGLILRPPTKYPRSRWSCVEPSLLLLHEDVGENYDAVARSAAAAVGAETCHLALYDAETDELIARRPSYGAAVAVDPPVPVPDLAGSGLRARGAHGRALPQQRPRQRSPLRRLREGPRSPRRPRPCPSGTAGHMLGLLYAINKPGGFTAEDVRTLDRAGGRRRRHHREHPPLRRGAGPARAEREPARGVAGPGRARSASSRP